MAADDRRVPNQRHGYLSLAQQPLVVLGHASPDAADFVRQVLVDGARQERLKTKTFRERRARFRGRHSPYDFLDYVAVSVDELHRFGPVGFVGVKRKVQVLSVERKTSGGHVIQSRFLYRTRWKIHLLPFARPRLAGQYSGKI